MKDKTLKTLEYDKILSMLAAGASSAAAKEKLLGMSPMTDQISVMEALGETTEAVSVIVRKGNAPLGQLYDIDGAMSFAKKGGSLTMKQLLQILYNIRVASNVITFLKSDLPVLPVIDSIRDALETFPRLEENIDRCIISEDEMADNASPKLKDIRRSIHRQNDAIKNRLNNILNSQDNKIYLQDSIVTIRDGRYVVPVKAEHRARFPGIVHDQSSTGATIFIEPQVIVNLNNELRELELAEQVEIERILAELSSNVAEHYAQIMNNQKLLTMLDIIFAKGKLSIAMKGEEPHITSDGAVTLKQARHPLIEYKKAVPIDVSVGDGYTTLVVTGPNTGGKTVTLKTVGLLTLMAQSGLHIPASSESRISVFDQVYADIGDEQSIEQSLSTFSSHMKNIVEILQEVRKDCLVLLDELGAGTDPVEGAALAIAVIQQVRQAGARVAATTHYAELKTFAMTTAGVENASCEFDVETLSPTYRLLIGIPGKSNAFAISQRLGLPETVITAAKEQMNGESVRFEDVLTQLEAKRQALEKREQEAERLYRQREEDARKAREFREQMERAKENARSRGEAEAKRILRDARTAADQVFSELSEMRKAQAKAERSMNENEARAALRRRLNEAEEAVSKRDARQEPIPKPSRPIRKGDLVELPGVKTPAEVVSVGSDGMLQLKAGILKMKARADEVRLIEDDERAARKKQPSVPIRQSAGRALRSSAARELDIRGLETLEAEGVVENFLSAAVMGKLETVVIIHGKGTGALRKAVHDILRRNKAVKSFRLGVYGEGESGVTVVTLK